MLATIKTNKMKKIIYAFFCSLCFITTSFAQNNITINKPIKVYLMGVFHFTQTDSSYNTFYSPHQSSIGKLCEIISSVNPNKIFVERQPEYEIDNKIDSLYKRYQEKNEALGKNEIYQIGFRAAKKLGHNKVYQCDHPGQYGRFYRAAKEYADKNNQSDILRGTVKGTIMRYDNLINEDSIMKNSTLLDYIKWINSDAVMNTSHASYIANYTQIGSKNYYNPEDEDTLIGAELTADWYKRNIMIYTKIINQLNYSENAIFLLIGADHIPIIKSLFEGNPYFSVVEAGQWLK